MTCFVLNILYVRLLQDASNVRIIDELERILKEAALVYIAVLYQNFPGWGE
jgi:hypothetical protein